MEKILHIVDRMDRGGAEMMIMNLYRVLDRNRFQFDFLYFTEKKCDFDDEIRDLGGTIFNIPESIKDPFTRIITIRKLLRKNKDIRIIHCHTLFSIGLHLFAGRLAGVPVRIAHSHNTSDKKGSDFFRQVYHTLMRKMIFANATHYISCGEKAKTFLFPKVKKKILLLNNAIDTEFFSRIGRENENYFRNEFHLQDNCLVVVQIGSINKTKNQEFTLRLSEALNDLEINHQIFIIGEGDDRIDLENLASSKNFRGNVIFLGKRKDIPNLLGGADLMLMPSLHEGFPVVLVEAQAAGTPALISENISKEVDLGVELVNYESLSSDYKHWIEKIKYIRKQKKIANSERLAILKQKGFDTKDSCQKLTHFYLNV
ncbi:glycosyltransferase EpsF [Salegentibacter echinorum]|uniref:Glycosyltransferase EpsF n=1 Tax=Salegentibacter echinorum TaxID=1073325 RepID=A0A1M5BUS3_SALEC|nr:glycosyltransferase [Salegentibacter echinorum]SHF46314.1 glycosyltransferase EpsF [Salegentibacter echinorum]